MVIGQIILHANNNGSFDHLKICEDFKGEVVEKDLWVFKGDHVESFIGANNAIGTLVVRFDSEEMMKDAITDQCWWEIVVK